LWVDLGVSVLVLVLDFVARIGRPLTQEIWSADAVVTGMVAV
jgi:hypothetical protein